MGVVRLQWFLAGLKPKTALKPCKQPADETPDLDAT